MKMFDALGGRYSYAQRINERGQVAGSASLANGAIHAALWDADGTHNLGTLGGRDSMAEGLNNRGQIVGFAYRADDTLHAFISAAGVMHDLNDMISPDSGWTLQTAKAINDAGQIVGNGVASDGNTRAFLLTPLVARASRLSEKTSAPEAQEPPERGACL